MPEDLNNKVDNWNLSSRKNPRGFFVRNERVVSFLAFIAGFAWDAYFLTKVNFMEARILYLVNKSFYFSSQNIINY